MLPSDIVFPRVSDLTSFNSMKDVENYARNLSDTLTQMYSDMVDNINGSIKQWTPTISGSTTPGTGTYSLQIGWYRRSGIMTQLWGNVAWSAHSGSGNITLESPYEAAESDGYPFIGVCASSVLALSSGFTFTFIRIGPSTFTLEAMQGGSGNTVNNISLASSGAISFFIEYIGKELQVG